MVSRRDTDNGHNQTKLLLQPCLLRIHRLSHQPHDGARIQEKDEVVSSVSFVYECGVSAPGFSHGVKRRPGQQVVIKSSSHYTTPLFCGIPACVTITHRLTLQLPLPYVEHREISVGFFT